MPQGNDAAGKWKLRAIAPIAPPRPSRAPTIRGRGTSRVSLEGKIGLMFVRGQARETSPDPRDVDALDRIRHTAPRRRHPIGAMSASGTKRTISPDGADVSN
jgi:hypothetical protein